LYGLVVVSISQTRARLSELRGFANYFARVQQTRARLRELEGRQLLLKFAELAAVEHDWIHFTLHFEGMDA
jgi:hypothetical protein